VQRGAHADEGAQHPGEGDVVVPVVKVPSLVVMTDQTRMARPALQQVVEQPRTGVLVSRVDDGDPVGEQAAGPLQVPPGDRSIDVEAGRIAASLQFGGGLRRIIHQIRGQIHRIGAVRVEQHKPITAQ
jgi:hypothetical protein